MPGRNSEENKALHQSEGAADQLRSDSMRAASETVAGVEKYEVVLAELLGAKGCLAAGSGSFGTPALPL